MKIEIKRNSWKNNLQTQNILKHKISYLKILQIVHSIITSTKLITHRIKIIPLCIRSTLKITIRFSSKIFFIIISTIFKDIFFRGCIGPSCANLLINHQPAIKISSNETRCIVESCSNIFHRGHDSFDREIDTYDLLGR